MEENAEDSRAGCYRCAACGAVLFRAAAKFDADTGYPTFRAPATPDSVRAVERRSHGVHRTQVRCACCRAHLGHVFAGDAQKPKRYCIAHDVLTFAPGASG